MTDTNRHVAELWMLHRDAKGLNIFSDDGTIYSYGKHFPIARHIRNQAHRDCILLTTERYSKTTSKHTSLTLEEIHRVWPSSRIVERLFLVPNVMAETHNQHLANHKAMVVSAENLQKRSNRALSDHYKRMHAHRASLMETSAQRYYEGFIGSAING